MTITSLVAAAAGASSRGALLLSHSSHRSAAALPSRLLPRYSQALVDSFSFSRWSSTSCGYASSPPPRGGGGGVVTPPPPRHRGDRQQRQWGRSRPFLIGRYRDDATTAMAHNLSGRSSAPGGGGRGVVHDGASFLRAPFSSLPSPGEPHRRDEDGGTGTGAGAGPGPGAGGGGPGGTTTVVATGGGTSGRDRLDARASAKLEALSVATRLAEEAGLALRNPDPDGHDGDNRDRDDDSSKLRQPLLEELGARHRDLSRAYSQAIRYVARTRSRDAASDAEDLLHKMIARTGAPKTPNNIENYNPMLSLARGDSPGKYGIRLPELSSTFPPPSKSDFVNVLRSWSTSKVRRKGVRAEALLGRMAELAWWYPGGYGGLVPDSKCFAMGIKSLAGSTHKDSLDSIVRLHEAHDLLAERGHGREQDEHEQLLVGNSRSIAAREDPFLLMNSLSALKNYRIEQEAELSTRWLDALHARAMELVIADNVVVNPGTAAAAEIENEGKARRDDEEGVAAIATGSYIREDGDDDDNDDDNYDDTRGEIMKDNGRGNVNGNASNIVVDLTATYTGVLRNHARARLPDSHVRAREVLDRMVQLRDVVRATSASSSTTTACSTAAATIGIDVRTNSYDLTISCLRNACSRQKRRDGKSNNGLARDALRLLDEMISAWKEGGGGDVVGDNGNGGARGRGADGGSGDDDGGFVTSEAVTTEHGARRDTGGVPDAANSQREKMDGSVPHPSESSFVFTLQALSHASAEEFAEDAGRLLEDLELLYAHEAGTGASSGTPTNPSSAAGYNAFLDLYIRWFANDERLLPKVMEIIGRMESMSSSSHVPGGGADGADHPRYGPDVTSWSHVLKACSVAQENERARALTLARSTFERLTAEKEGRRKVAATAGITNGDYADGREKMTDSCYFYMMNCVARHVEDAKEKESSSKDLFRDACRRGLVSANVLRALKSAVSEADFKEIVGEGRLPDQWVKNVTSVKALYTDMTKGGERKNARRKGKSTSGWARKQKEREQKLLVKRAEKRRKRVERRKA